MADFLPTLLKEPTTALKGLKPTNPILRDLFLAIPENERRGVTMPERGHALKLWLEQWAVDKQNGKSQCKSCITASCPLNKCN
jgi:hypothetical protein